MHHILGSGALRQVRLENVTAVQARSFLQGSLVRHQFWAAPFDAHPQPVLQLQLDDLRSFVWKTRQWMQKRETWGKSRCPESIGSMELPFRKWVSPCAKSEEVVGGAVAPPGYRKLRGETRLVTKKAIRDFLCRFVGYVTRVRGSKISSLDQLLTPDLLREFLGWCQDSRHIKASDLKPDLASLHAAVKKYRRPPLAGKDFHWIRELMRELRQESPSQIR
jgi:hypothetical protein